MMPLQKQHYVVCYDVLDDRRRQKIAKILLDYGTRVQKSVFELYIVGSDFIACIEKLQLSIHEEDAMRIYVLSKVDYSRTMVIGTAEKHEELSFIII